MSDDQEARLATEAAEAIRQAEFTIAVTGAGISVPSGIPDFRSPKSGLWTKYDPMKVAHINAFLQRPQDYYDWMRLRLEVFSQAKPNPAHFALAELFRKKKLHALITQNIDGLHERAGGGPIHALHGQAFTSHCLKCHKEFATISLVEAIQAGEVPYCECGGLIKPDIVLFGEALPMAVLSAAEQAARKADLCLIIGTGLEVYPAAALPEIVLHNGGELIIINKSPIDLGTSTRFVFYDDVVDVLPAIVAQV
jgi:NAD-dependent deacetylase